MSSAIIVNETGNITGEPIELYRFDVNGVQYLYTSSAEEVTITYNDNRERYHPEIISRENIIPSCHNSVEKCEVEVTMDNVIATMYESYPTEKPITLEIIRLHASDTSKYDIVLRGTVSQVQFEDSQCKLTISLEQWLDKELPNGLNQYYCDHVVFNHNCKLDIASYMVNIDVMTADTMSIRSPDFALYPDNYFAGGKVYYDNRVRMIFTHVGDTITMKYPFATVARGIIRACPGCDGLFTTCAKKYNNTLHFSGIPYCMPTDSEKNPTGRGAYWVDSLVIRRDTDGFIGTITGV